METSAPVERFEKLVRHWSSARELDIVFRIEFTREGAAGDCQIYRIHGVEELTN